MHSRAHRPRRSRSEEETSKVNRPPRALQGTSLSEVFCRKPSASGITRSRPPLFTIYPRLPRAFPGAAGPFRDFPPSASGDTWSRPGGVVVFAMILPFSWREWWTKLEVLRRAVHILGLLKDGKAFRKFPSLIWAFWRMGVNRRTCHERQKSVKSLQS